MPIDHFSLSFLFRIHTIAAAVFTITSIIQNNAHTTGSAHSILQTREKKSEQWTSIVCCTPISFVPPLPVCQALSLLKRLSLDSPFSLSPQSFLISRQTIIFSFVKLYSYIYCTNGLNGHHAIKKRFWSRMAQQ